MSSYTGKIGMICKLVAQVRSETCSRWSDFHFELFKLVWSWTEIMIQHISLDPSTEL